MHPVHGIEIFTRSGVVDAGHHSPRVSPMRDLRLGGIEVLDMTALDILSFHLDIRG